jgi:SAM domain (Sterile alpha motif)
MDLGGWLRSLGLERYEAAFRENEIDEAVLPGLTHETLKELGVTAVGHRLKLLDAIAALRNDDKFKVRSGTSSINTVILADQVLNCARAAGNSMLCARARRRILTRVSKILAASWTRSDVTALHERDVTSSHKRGSRRARDGPATPASSRTADR